MEDIPIGQPGDCEEEGGVATVDCASPAIAAADADGAAVMSAGVEDLGSGDLEEAAGAEEDGVRHAREEGKARELEDQLHAKHLLRIEEQVQRVETRLPDGLILSARISSTDVLSMKGWCSETLARTLSTLSSNRLLHSGPQTSYASEGNGPGFSSHLPRVSNGPLSAHLRGGVSSRSLPTWRSSCGCKLEQTSVRNDRKRVEHRTTCH